MINIKDLIKSRLNKITDLNERKIMKKVLTDVHEEVINYNMDKYKQLEENIYTEIEDNLDKFYVYICIINRSLINSKSDFFHPISSLIYKENIENKEPKFTIFLKCNYLVIKGLLNLKKVYKVIIETNINNYIVDAILEQNNKYINEIQNLYEIFKLNSIEWNTINCSYLYKFIDIKLSEYPNFQQNEEILEFNINLEEYDKYKSINIIPVWNIKKLCLSDNSFPTPTNDNKNYIHDIELTKSGSQNGYMISRDNIKFEEVKRIDNSLIITSHLSKQNDWNLIKFENISNIDTENINLEYEILSNKRNLGFLGRFASLKSLIIKTRGELARIAKSYDLDKSLSFFDVEIVNKYNKTEQTVNYNFFIKDEIRENNSKQIMIIKFQAKDRNDFLIFDKMSFLVSVFQSMFLEYKCIGELI